MKLKIQILSHKRLQIIFIKLVKSSDFRMRVPSEKIRRTILPLVSAFVTWLTGLAGFFHAQLGFLDGQQLGQPWNFTPQ